MRIKTPKATDSVSRMKQARKWVRLIAVHRMTRKKAAITLGDADEIAEKLGCSQRTVWRDLQTLRLAYVTLGTNSFDK